VERGLAYDFNRDEIDSWNQETRERYARGGASIASNESIGSGSSDP
jgi:hypothetical protein